MRFMSGTPSNDMPAIVPRWEWRTFGSRFGRAEDHFAALTPREVKESDELYFLSADGDTVKVRDGLMDIKVLKEVNADGLEQWTPVMKSAFPLPRTDVAKVFEALRLDTPPLARDASGQRAEPRRNSRVESGALLLVGISAGVAGHGGGFLQRSAGYGVAEPEQVVGMCRRFVDTSAVRRACQAL